MADPKKTPNDPLSAAQFPIGGTVVGGDDARDDQPMTDIQATELRQLCEEKGEPMDANLTQRQASQRIAALRAM